MRLVRIILICAWAGSAVVATGCWSGAATAEPEDVHAVVDQAVAAGADIPASQRDIVVRMLRLSERDLTQGLRTFAELSGGRYPTSLDTKSTLKQVERDQVGFSTPALSQSQKEKMLQDIFFACAFYETLQKEHRDVQYYGDTVRPADVAQVLVCWTQPNGRYRVVLGNLNTRTLTAEELAEFRR